MAVIIYFCSKERKADMDLKAISIAQFKLHEATQLNDSRTNVLSDDIIITNNVEYSELFKYPCRLDAITMLVCVKGELKGNLNLKEHTTRKNGVMVCLPEDIIQIESVRDLEAYAVIISASFLREAHIDIQKLLPLYLGIKNKPQIYYLSDQEMQRLQYYHILATEVLESSDNEHKREIIKGLLSALTYNVIDLIRHKQEKEKETYLKSTQRIEILFDKFMLLLNKHHTKEHSVKFYANEMHLTANYLSGVIKEFSGKTAAGWIDEYIILEAQTLLKFSGMTIQQIAYHLNFTTQSSFGKYFKQQTGMSPKKYILNN